MKDILKWYDMLAFPIDWKQEVVKAAEHFEPGINPVTAMENLLGALHACEKLEKIYEQKGIEKNILIDTLSDLVIWAKNCYLVTGEIGITEQAWIDSHLRGELFRLGRLQFRFGKLAEENHRLLSSCGDPAIEVHIPQGDALDWNKCRQSFRQAVSFFDTYFPAYRYTYFTCESWLLDFHLKEFLKPDSNILKFQSEFDIFLYRESEQAIRHLFTLNQEKNKENSLQKKVREHIDGGGKMFSGYGVINKERFVDAEGRERNESL